MSPAGAVLLDTCAVTYLANGDPMSRACQDAVPSAALGAGVLVSSVSAWEVGLLARPANRSRLQFLPDPKTWFARVLAAPGLRLGPLTPDIAVDSSTQPGAPRGDPADRLLIATARSLNVP